MQQNKYSIGNKDSVNIKSQTVEKQFAQFNKARVAEITQVENEKTKPANSVKQQHNQQPFEQNFIAVQFHNHA